MIYPFRFFSRELAVAEAQNRERKKDSTGEDPRAGGLAARRVVFFKTLAAEL